jgi:hypothetical protein
MASGRVLSLGPENQALLALWATKTAMTLMVTSDTQSLHVIPVEHRHSVRHEDRPSDTIWVGYLPWRGSTLFTATQTDVVRSAPATPARRYTAYGSVFAFARLAFSVVGFTDTLDPEDVIDGTDRPFDNSGP